MAHCEVINEFRPLLMHKALHSMRLRMEDAEDLVQDTMVCACRSWDTFDPSRGALPTWLSAILTNQYKDRLRRNAGKPPSLPLDEDLVAHGADPAARIDDISDMCDVNAAMRALPRSAREVLRLKARSLTYREIGAIVGANHRTVGMRVRRARLLLLRTGE
jgi:RNA polymerase sigma-70 factor (ECF subfamily)